jgi:glyoxylase-like metal-dependent hydrolase (beta-lactamase superfamily II)
MHPEWLSNAYLVADEPGGSAVFVDSGAPLQPLLEAVDRHGLKVTHVLTTHGDHDHVAGHDVLLDRFGVPAWAEEGELETGGLRVRALPTPGHSDDHLAFVFGDDSCFAGDVLFKDAVGGGQDVPAIRRSVMEVLMKLPPETRVYPGHTDETTIGREWDENPFVRVWRGLDPEVNEPCRVGGEEATILVWSPDYDGKGKAWVRFADGREAILGGSRIERS